MVPVLERQLRHQAAACAAMGAPLYAALLAAAADDLVAGGPTADVLAAHAGDPAGSALPLRLMAALHRQVLTRRAPRLALHYPSVGGSAGVDGAWDAARDLLATRATEIAADVRRPCQTNEPGRAAGLLIGLMHAATVHRKPLRLLEIGASAGLNLQVDRYRLGRFGPPGPVLIDDPWDGPSPADQPYQILERGGCDPAPIDPTSEAGRLALTSSVWADQTVRFARLRTALGVAARHPLSVDRQAASGWLTPRLAEPRPGVLTVVWHSVCWQYLCPAEQEAVTALLHAAGDRATSGAPLVHLSYEPSPRGRPVGLEFPLRATTWPGATQAVLAEGGAHGPPVRLVTETQ